jgi:cytoskeletal protein RodZ
MTRLDEVLGVLALAGYIVAIVGLAAAITWVVIKIFPTERNPKKPDADEKPASESKPSDKSAESGGGALFRRSKRRG